MSEAIARLVKVAVFGIVEKKCRISVEGRQTRPEILQSVDSITMSGLISSFVIGRSSGPLELYFCNENPPESQS